MAFGPVFKEPDERILRGFDWSAVSARHPEPLVITDSVWRLDPPADDITLADNGVQDLVTSVVIAGGTAGRDYFVENRIICGNGLVFVRGFHLRVRERL